MINRLFILIIGIAFVGCGADERRQQDDWDKSNMRSFDSDDAEVKEAKRLTKENMTELSSSFELHNADTAYRFYVKKKFVDGEIIEHIWCVLLDVGANGYMAIIDNVPSGLDNVSYEDTVNISFKEIEDFLVYHGDTIVAGDYFNVAKGIH